MQKNMAIILLTFFMSIFSIVSVSAELPSASNGYQVNKSVETITQETGLDAEATTRVAEEMSKPSKILNAVIGLLSLVAITGITVITLFDMVYLSVPVLRPFLEKANLVSSEGIEASKLGGFQPTQPRGDVHSTTSKNEGDNPTNKREREKTKLEHELIAYIKMRAVVLILLGVCLALFTTTVLTDLGLTIISIVM